MGAAIVAARREKDIITFDEIDFAIDRLQVGMQKPSIQGFQNKENARKRQELVAWHEAGHAVMAALTPGYDGVAKVTIIPRTNGAGGFTLFTPSGNTERLIRSLLRDIISEPRSHGETGRPPRRERDSRWWRVPKNGPRAHIVGAVQHRKSPRLRKFLNVESTDCRGH